MIRWTRRRILYTWQILAGVSIWPLKISSAFAQFDEFPDRVGSEDDSIEETAEDMSAVITALTSSATNQTNQATTSQQRALVNKGAFALATPEVADKGSYIVSLGLQLSEVGPGQGLNVTGGVVFAYDPGVLQFGPFLTVTPTVSSAVLPQAGVSLAGSFGRGNVPRGFFGTSSTGILNSGLGDITLAVDYTQNDNYDGLGASAGLGIETLPSYSFTNGSETYGVSDLTTIDGGAAMEDVYNALLRSSQDPFGGAHF